MKFSNYIIFFIIAGLLLPSACAAEPQTPPPTVLLGNQGATAPLAPPLNEEKIAQGQPLYNQYCASCHGINGEGHPEWRVPNEDGSFKPPPHDSTGHTWHHDDDLLFDLIKNGSDFPDTRMPVYKDQLNDEEIQAILEYIKAWWGPEERQIQWERTWQARQ